MIPFNKPYMTGKELYNISQAHVNGMLAGDGPFTEKCHHWLEENSGTKKALLTHSCTAALEMAALLIGIQTGDEIIMPSYTFVSTANAFVLRGGTPVFVDIRPDTLNLDEARIEEAITPRTKAIVPVHYAGVACEMETITRIAGRYGLAVVEDSAQGIMSTYKGSPLGSLGNLGTFSFHETKNVISGEGGALLVNDRSLVDRAEIIREKGTDRSRFFRGEVDKYTWQDHGSSFLPGELIAAFLYAQLEEARQITDQRLTLWNNYHDMLSSLEKAELVQRPYIPDHCTHNAHMYYVILPRRVSRERVLDNLRRHRIRAVFHYTPLHTSPAGRRFGKIAGRLPATEDLAERVIRLPLWIGLEKQQQEFVVETLKNAVLAA